MANTHGSSFPAACSGQVASLQTKYEALRRQLEPFEEQLAALESKAEVTKTQHTLLTEKVCRCHVRGIPRVSHSSRYGPYTFFRCRAVKSRCSWVNDRMRRARY